MVEYYILPNLLQAYNRIIEVASAVNKLIQSHLPVGSIVAVTHFNSYAYTLSPMTEITSENIRNTLVANLPMIAYGGTNIDDGLELCKEVRPVRQYFS